MYNSSIRQRLISALADNRDLNVQLIGLRGVVEEFIVRLDFMLKCKESPESCLNDLRQLSDDLDEFVKDVYCNEDQGGKAIVGRTIELSQRRRECCSLEHENRRLKGMVEYLENERAELSASAFKTTQLEHALAEAQTRLKEKDCELNELKVGHETELNRLQESHRDEISDLKKSITSANRIIDRWKNIYHEDMMRVHSRGVQSATVKTQQSS